MKTVISITTIVIITTIVVIITTIVIIIICTYSFTAAASPAQKIVFGGRTNNQPPGIGTIYEKSLFWNGVEYSRFLWDKNSK